MTMWYSTAGCMVILILSLLVTPPAAQAQPLSRVPQIGGQGDGSPLHPFIAAFQQGLRELGYIEGQNIVIAYRYAHGMVDQIPTHVAELLDLHVDVLVVGGTA